MTNHREPSPAARKFISDYIKNFIDKFADSKVARPGGWMPYQHKLAVEIVISILYRQMRLFTVLMARQMGKTEAVSIALCCAIMIIFFTRITGAAPLPEFPQPPEIEETYPDGVCIGIYGADQSAAAVDYKRIQRIMRRVCKSFGLRRDPDNTERLEVFYHKDRADEILLCIVEIKSAMPTSKIESRSWNVILCEEAQDMLADVLYNAIDPTGGASTPTRLRVGTIGDKKCAFDEEIDMNKAQFPENHFEFDYQVGVSSNFRNGAYERFINQQIAQHGYDSPFFKRKYRLIREYESGMLCSEDQFVLEMSRPRERRWSETPRELPDNVVLVASLDVARSNDQSILKIGTSDWRFVSEDAPKPIVIERASSSYGEVDYDVQFAQMKLWLESYPLLKQFGVLVIDATGDRGDMVGKFTNAGYSVIALVFSGGNRPTEFDDKTQELKPGSKSALCIDYIEQIGSKCYGYAALPADPAAPPDRYMGTVDFYRAIGKSESASDFGFDSRRHVSAHAPSSVILNEVKNLSAYDDRPTYPPDRDYRDHKHEATHCFRSWVGTINKSLVLQADPKDRFAHDDHVMADVMLVFAGLYCRPVDLSLVKTTGSERAMPGLQPDSFRSAFATVARIFS